MPELPEVEITARRLSTALEGAEVESAVAAGVATLKTFEPSLDALVGDRVAGVRRIGKMLAVDFEPGDGAGPLTLLIHLMSAGRLQLFDKRASLRDRRSRILVRHADGRELRLREFGTKQSAWAKLLPRDEVEADEMVATLGPDAWPAPPLEQFREAVAHPRHLHPLLRHQRDIAGIGRSWVDEILWEARLSPFKKGSELRGEEVKRLHDALRRHRAGQDAHAAQGPSPRGRALPALWDHDRGGLLRRAPDELLPGGADRRARAQGPAALPPPEVAR
jgi:formamidopyrimidine-DNA glycosylase